MGRKRIYKQKQKYECGEKAGHRQSKTVVFSLFAAIPMHKCSYYHADFTSPCLLLVRKKVLLFNSAFTCPHSPGVEIRRFICFLLRLVKIEFLGMVFICRCSQ